MTADMTTMHLILRWAHISMGLVAIAAGAAAMALRKGSRPHYRAGNAFFVSMLVMAGAGAILSLFPGSAKGNVLGGLLAFYLTLTAWATVWRRPGETGRLEVAGALLGLATGILGMIFGAQAAASPTGRAHGYPPPLYFVMGGIALVATALDARMIARGGFTGVTRTTRHLSRMCLAMFMATGSFFLGQAKLFPAAVRESGINRIPVYLLIGAFLWWLVRLRVVPALERMRATRALRALRVSPRAS